MNYQVLIQSVRIGLYCLVILLLALSSILEKNFYNWNLALVFYGFAGAGALLNFLPLLSLDKFFKKSEWVFISFVVDIALTTGLVIFSQLNQAVFLFLYMILIILSGLVFHSRGALLIAAMVSIAYTIGSWFGPEVKALSYLFLMILNNTFFFLVALISGFLSDQLSLFAEKIEVQNISLKIIRKLNEMIVDTIPLGLLSVNEKAEIIQLNPGAAAILREPLDSRGISLVEKIPEIRNQPLNLHDLQGRLEFTLQWSPDVPSDESGKVKPEAKFLKFQVLPQAHEFAEKTFLVVIEDQTEKQQLEFAVRQSEKMAAVGQLAAGIAHEIRNPLAGISGSVELLSQSFSSDDDRKLGKIILKEIDRLNRLISEFLDFAKPEKPPTEIVDLNSLLDEVIKQSVSSLPRAVQIEQSFSGKAPILGYADKLKQAFLNIIINSIQAMDKISDPKLIVRTEFLDQQIVVRIKDNGCGMKEETRLRMFEPFHTTKPKGTGLGLAITHKILEAHRARVYVSSEVGLGTEFVISFPSKNY